MRKFLTTVQLKDSAFDTGLSQLWDPNVLSSSLSRQCIWGIGATQVSQDGRAAITYVRSWCSCPACWFSRLAVLIMCTYTLLCLWPHYWPRLWHYCRTCLQQMCQVLRDDRSVQRLHSGQVFFILGFEMFRDCNLRFCFITGQCNLLEQVAFLNSTLPALWRTKYPQLEMWLMDRSFIWRQFVLYKMIKSTEPYTSSARYWSPRSQVLETYTQFWFHLSLHSCDVMDLW